MNFERLRWGEWIAAICAVDLLLVTFRAWYKVSGGGGRVTAWDALHNGRILLIATAVVGIFLLLMRAAEDTQQLSFPPGWIAAAVGLACTIYVAYRLATPPADNLDPDIGLFLGLASAFGVAVGGLLSAREPEPYAGPERTASEVAQDTFTGPSDQQEPLGALVPDSGGTWSAAPAASGWSPAAPAAPVPPATSAGALGGADRPLRSGDSVVLTAGGARFPAGTVAEVIEVFAGGALVQVKAPDGMAERFEVPESAYERAGAGGAAPAGESWSPAMPAPASQDWGFDESRAEDAAAGTATETAEPGAGEGKPAKVPWWKREIGGGKKKKEDDHGAEIAAAGAVAAGAAAVEAERNGAGEEKPGFFKRLFGGGGPKDEPATETLEAEPTPTSDVAGLGAAAESDTAIGEPLTESAVDDGPSVDAAHEAADPEAPAADDHEAAISGPRVSEPDEVVTPEPTASAPEPAASAPEPTASTPDPATPEPEPAASAPEPEPEVVVDPQPPAAPEPEVVASEEPTAASAPDAEPAPREPEVVVTPDPAPEPEPAPSAPDAPAAEEEAAALKPRRRRSSGSRKVPKEALAGAAGDQPKVGDEVQLKVGGGRFDAGTKGTVVDVFSAGVIVELSDDEGRTERLDLPFEAIGPADA